MSQLPANVELCACPSSKKNAGSQKKREFFEKKALWCAPVNRFDWDGQVHLAKGKTGGQQGDPLEILIFNLTIHHLWGRVLAKFPEARAIPYDDDGYIKNKIIYNPSGLGGA